MRVKDHYSFFNQSSTEDEKHLFIYRVFEGKDQRRERSRNGIMRPIGKSSQPIYLPSSRKDQIRERMNLSGL